MAFNFNSVNGNIVVNNNNNNNNYMNNSSGSNVRNKGNVAGTSFRGIGAKNLQSKKKLKSQFQDSFVRPVQLQDRKGNINSSNG